MQHVSKLCVLLCIAHGLLLHATDDTPKMSNKKMLKRQRRLAVAQAQQLAQEATSKLQAVVDRCLEREVFEWEDGDQIRELLKNGADRHAISYEKDQEIQLYGRRSRLDYSWDHKFVFNYLKKLDPKTKSPNPFHKSRYLAKIIVLPLPLFTRKGY